MSVRYDRDVRALVLAFAVSCVAATSLAHARRPPRDVDLDPFGKRSTQAAPEPCTQGKTWNAVLACLNKQAAPEILYDTEVVKIVRLSPKPPAKVGMLQMFTRREKLWVRSGFYQASFSERDQIQIAAFPTPTGDGVRVDTSSAFPSVFSPGPGATAARGLVQRTTSMVCAPTTWSCRTVLTSCDAYLRGRLVWTFRGELYWHPSLGVRLRGDGSRAGGQCQPPKYMMDPDDAADEP